MYEIWRRRIGKLSDVYQDTIWRASDNAWIPTDTQNNDYLVYLEWVSQGNEAPVIEN